MVDCGQEYGLIEKSGTWYSYKGERIGQGRENVKKLLKENKDLAAKLEYDLRKKVGLIVEPPAPENAEKEPGKSQEKGSERKSK